MNGLNYLKSPRKSSTNTDSDSFVTMDSETKNINQPNESPRKSSFVLKTLDEDVLSEKKSSNERCITKIIS